MKLGKYILALMMALGFANVSFADCCNCDKHEEAAAEEETTAAQDTEESAETAESTEEAEASE